MLRPIPVFVINLKRNPERKAFVLQQVAQLGVEPEIIEATDGKTLSRSDEDRLYARSRSRKLIGYELRPSEIGCAHSHARIYRRMVDESIPYAMILEDDVELDSRVAELLRETPRIMASCDWLQINYPPVGYRFLSAWIKAANHQVEKNPATIPYTLAKLPLMGILSLYEGVRASLIRDRPRVCRFGRPLYLAGAYIVSNKGARKLLPLCEPLLFAADMLPNKARIAAGLRMRGVVPILARQRTDIFHSENI